MRKGGSNSSKRNVELNHHVKEDKWFRKRL
jgi:hypothetical protein